MNKSGFSYLKLTAVVAVLALTVIAGVRPSTATKQPLVATAVPSADLANEERTLAKYFDDLVTYDKQTADLGKKASLVKADLDPLQRQSDDLKGRLSGLQNVIAEIVKKLKAAKEWDDLDTTTAAKITDARQKSFFGQDSFKQLLEESSSNLTGHGNEISLPLDNLRKKLTSRTLSPYGDGADLQIVRAAYEAPAPVFFHSLGCTVGRIHIGIIHKLGGDPLRKTWDQVLSACGIGGTPTN
jgi:small-conductance mechanosensitive channel